MFKFPIKKEQKPDSKFKFPARNQIFSPIFLVGGVIIFSLILTGFALSPLQSIEGTISQMQANAEYALQNQYQSTTKLSTTLFSDNLRRQATNFEISSSFALQETKKQIQEKHNCSLSLSEIASLLYFNNPEFGEYMNQAPKNNPKELPRKELSSQACLKLSQCLAPNNLNSIKLTTCTDLVTSIYTPIQKARAEQQIIQTANLGNNKYKNGDTQDSHYDLLQDIENIGKILFKGFKKAPEVIFYAPVNYNTKNTTPNSNTPTTNNASNNNSENQNHTSTKNTNNTETLSTEQSNKKSDTPLPVFSPTQDPEINASLHNTTPTVAKNTNNDLLFTNQCLPPNTIKRDQSTTTSLIQSTNDQSDNNSNSLNNQTIQQNLESSLSALKNISSPQIPQYPDPSRNTTITDTFPGKTEEQAQSCIQKCDARDAKGNYQLAIDERQICKLQCLCGEYSSPALEKGSEFPYLDEGALKIRFCTLPAKAILTNTNSKRVYSIAEIIAELESINTDLNQGGRLTIRQNKTNFLDSNLEQRSLAKTNAIFANLNQKSPQTTTTDKDKILDNQTILQQLNQISHSERNSYIVNTPTQTPSQKITTRANITTPTLSSPTETTLEKNNLANHNLHLTNFLAQQYEFLSEMQKTLSTMNQALTALNAKKK